MIHHFEIYVRNIYVTRAFYDMLLPQLGYKIKQEFYQGFTYENDTHYIVFVQADDAFLEHGYHRKRIGLNHMAFRAPSKEFIDSMKEKLSSKHVRMLYEDRFPYAGGKDYYALFFEDPDGIKLELAL